MLNHDALSYTQSVPYIHIAATFARRHRQLSPWLHNFRRAPRCRWSGCKVARRFGAPVRSGACGCSECSVRTGCESAPPAAAARPARKSTRAGKSTVAESQSGQESQPEQETQQEHGSLPEHETQRSHKVDQRRKVGRCMGRSRRWTRKLTAASVYDEYSEGPSF